MFDFIKKLLKEKDEEQVTLKLTFDEFFTWFDKHTAKKIERFTSFVEKQQRELNDLTQGTKEKVNALETTKLQNENIPTRAKSFMEGNRTSYMRIVNRFLDDIGTPQPSIDSVQEWVANYNTLAAEHVKSSARNYQILQQFFARELQNIGTMLKSIEQEVANVQDYLTSEGLADIERVKESATQLQSRITLKKTLKEQLVQEKKLFEGILKKKDKATEELKAFVESNEFKAHHDKIKEKDSKKDELKQHQNTLYSHFSSLDRALKKLTKVAMEHEELIVEYQYRPEKTVLTDSNLLILDILSQLKKSIEAGGIALDDKKKTKSLAAIAKLDRAFFEKYLGSYHRIHREIEQLDAQINSSDVRTKHEEVLSQVEKIDREVERLKRSLDECDEKDKQINLSEEKEELEMLIKAVMKQDIVLKI